MSADRRTFRLSRREDALFGHQPAAKAAIWDRRDRCLPLCGAGTPGRSPRSRKSVSGVSFVDMTMQP